MSYRGERYKVQGGNVYKVQGGGVYKVRGPENFFGKGAVIRYNQNFFVKLTFNSQK